MLRQEDLNSSFVNLCAQLTVIIKDSGLINFNFSLQSENLNYSLNTNNTESEKCGINIKRKKKKSPSSRKRNLIWLKNWLAIKQDLILDTTTQKNAESVGAVSLVVQDSIICATCDTEFKSERSLACQISRKHNNTICQLDGISCLDDDETRTSPAFDCDYDERDNTWYEKYGYYD